MLYLSIKKELCFPLDGDNLQRMVARKTIKALRCYSRIRFWGLIFFYLYGITSVQVFAKKKGASVAEPFVAKPSCVRPQVYLTTGYLQRVGQLDIFFESNGVLRFEYNPNVCKEGTGGITCENTFKKRSWQENIEVIQKDKGLLLIPASFNKSKDWVIQSSSSWMVAGVVSAKMIEASKRNTQVQKKLANDLKKLEQHGITVQGDEVPSGIQLSVNEGDFSLRPTILLRKDSISDARNSLFGALVTPMVQTGILLHAAFEIRPSLDCSSR